MPRWKLNFFCLPSICMAIGLVFNILCKSWLDLQQLSALHFSAGTMYLPCSEKTLLHSRKKLFTFCQGIFYLFIHSSIYLLLRCSVRSGNFHGLFLCTDDMTLDFWWEFQAFFTWTMSSLFYHHTFLYCCCLGLFFFFLMCASVYISS